MSTSTQLPTQKIKQSWDIKEMQKAATRMVSHKIASRIHFLDKHDGKEIDSMEKASAHLNSDMLLAAGIKNPLELVKHLAEYEVNMFGSEASISGDEQCATLINEKSRVWLETVKQNNLSDEQIDIMLEHYSAWMKHLGHRFGFKVHLEFAKDRNSSTATFTQK